MKEFLHNLVVLGMKKYKKAKFKKEMKESIQQAKDGKLISRGSFAKYAADQEKV